MYMSRITLRPDAGRDSHFWRLAAGQGQQDHKFLWQIFSDGPDRKRDFVFRRSDDARGAMGYLTVSARRPQEDGMWRTEVKPYQPKLRLGQRLAFSLRVNPVVSRRDQNGKQQRHDVVMDAKKTLEANKLPREQWPRQSVLVQEAGARWLAERAQGHGFQVMPEQVRAEGHHQVSFRKGSRVVSLSSLDLDGFLTVTDPSRFVETLYGGMGPAKGYGFGLMLVRPA